MPEVKRKKIKLDKFHSEVLCKALELLLLNDNLKLVVNTAERSMAKQMLQSIRDKAKRNVSLSADVQEEE